MSVYDKMSIAPIVLAQIGIMRRPHGADRRHDKMKGKYRVLDSGES